MKKLCLLFLATVMSVAKVVAADPVTVTDFVDLQTQIAAYETATEDMTIIVNQDITMTKTINIPANAGKTLTIKGDHSDRKISIKSNTDTPVYFNIKSATVMLESIHIDGEGYSCYKNYLVYLYGGNLTLSSGAILENYKEGVGINIYKGTLTMLAGSAIQNMTNPENGGAVWIQEGIFNMHGGSITGNKAENGGGVYVKAGTFTMTGGEITGNNTKISGGGVFVDGSTFTLGGTAVIKDNKLNEGTTKSNVYLPSHIFITLGNGNNGAPAPVPTEGENKGMEVGVTKTDNGGVFVNSGATPDHEQYFFSDASNKEIVYQKVGEIGKLAVMTPFEIFEQQVASYASATDDMTITVSQDLDAIRLVTIPANTNTPMRTLTITSAETTPASIKTIKRGKTGNLFTVSANAKLTLKNIIIDGNKEVQAYKTNTGFLVYVLYGAEFVMNNGAVLQNNMTGGFGGGVSSRGTFTMNGGTISKNTATGGGGGVYVLDGTFTVGGTAYITGNTKSGSTPNNVYLPSNRYITLGTGDNVPAEGMEVGVTKTDNNGIFVNSGATPDHEQYFLADETGKEIVCQKVGEVGKLAVMTPFEVFEQQVASYASATEDMTITVSQDLDAIRLVTIPANTNTPIRTLTITSAETTPASIKTIKRGKTGNLFTVSADAKLTLENIIIDGNNGSVTDAQGSLVKVLSDAEFVMNDGAVLQNNKTSGNGGGVYSTGSFTMNDGTISGNTASVGGGAYCNSASFTIGGTAKITGNTLNDNTTNNMYIDSGGYITLGTGSNGVPVPAEGMTIGVTKTANNGVFVESGATPDHRQYFLTDETGKEIVYQVGGKLAIVNTETAFEKFKRQVSLYEEATDDMIVTVSEGFNMEETITIPANAAGHTLTIASADAINTLTRGAGVTGNLFTVPACARLTLANITLDGNKTAVDDADGALLFVGGGTATLNDGTTLQNNQRTGDGSGVVIGGGAVSITGATITGNTADGCGGGVYVSGGTLTLGGATVVKDNSSTTDEAMSNVYLAADNYLTFATGNNAPCEGMEVWVNTASESGVVVNLDTEAAAHVPYLCSDVDGKTIQADGNKLVIGEPPVDPIINYHTLTLTTGTGIVIDKNKDSFQIQSGNPFSFVITLTEGYEGMTPTVTANNRTKSLISIGSDKWRCILSDIYEDTNVLVSLNLTGNDTPDAPQLYARGGQLFVDTPTDTPLRVYNITGQMVVDRRLTPGLTTIPLPAGIYIVQLDSLTKRIMVGNR